MSLAAPVAGKAESASIRVMVVDDSVVIRGLLSRWLRETPGVEVVAAHRNGKLAVDDVLKSDPHIIILDIEMPEMDGMTALPLLLAKKPGVKIIMASTLTRRNAEVSLKALALGAADYIPKPEGNHGITTSADFRRDLLARVKAFGGSVRRRTSPAAPKPGVTGKTGSEAPVRMTAAAGPGGIALQPFSRTPPRLLAIGSSTGGPQALAALMTSIGPVLDKIPTVITQHMPPTFTTILAENLGRASGRPCKEAEHGDILKKGAIYVAPGGKHMLLVKGAGNVVIRLDDGPPVNFCKPAVDPMFNSIAPIFGPATLAVVLTGMGHDGAAGAGTIRQTGGSIIAQDEATSVVWGMPGATAEAGICSAVLPLDAIGNKIKQIIGRGAV